MARFDRYMLSQLMVLFSFFSLVLVLVYWINRAVVLFDQLIADGQSAWVFLEFTALSLPSVIRLALPLATFAAAIYVTNRMTNESEMVIVQATGFSPFRLARPVLYFGLIVFALMSILSHSLVPLSAARLDDRQGEIAQNITARLLTEGQFQEPLDGVTLYIGEITAEGELRNVFLSDIRDPVQEQTYTASRAYLVRTQSTAQLVMVDGMAQTLRMSDQSLFTTSFNDLVYDIGGLIASSGSDNRRAQELSTLELLRPSPALEEETGRTHAQLIAEAHDRISQSLLGTVAALIGFGSLMVGGFSRFGVWRQILVATFLIIIVKGVETFGLNIARSNASLWPATYLSSALGFVFAWMLLILASRPTLFRRNRPQPEGAA